MADFTNDQNKNENEVKDNNSVVNNGVQNTGDNDAEDKNNDAKDNASAVVTPLTAKSIEDRSDVSDIDDHHRTLVVTEKDGTKIQVQLIAPNWGDAEEIDAKRNAAMQTDNGEMEVVSTPKRFHESLFKMFNGLMVNDKPVAEKFDWGFLQKHSRETYNFFMNEADTFLTNQLNAA